MCHASSLFPHSWSNSRVGHSLLPQLIPHCLDAVPNWNRGIALNTFWIIQIIYLVGWKQHEAAVRFKLKLPQSARKGSDKSKRMSVCSCVYWGSHGRRNFEFWWTQIALTKDIGDLHEGRKTFTTALENFCACYRPHLGGKELLGGQNIGLMVNDVVGGWIWLRMGRDNLNGAVLKIEGNEFPRGNSVSSISVVYLLLVCSALHGCRHIENERSI